MTNAVSGSGLRGAIRLTFDGIAGLIELVETMHATIARRPGPFGSHSRERTRGITGLVYRTVRGGTYLAGAGVDAALALLDPVLAAGEPAPGWEAARAALNGVLGDNLLETANPLAIPMCLRHGGQPLRLQKDSLTGLAPLSGRLAVLVHGLCLNDRQWNWGATITAPRWHVI